MDKEAVSVGQTRPAFYAREGYDMEYICGRLGIQPPTPTVSGYAGIENKSLLPGDKPVVYVHKGSKDTNRYGIQSKGQRGVKELIEKLSRKRATSDILYLVDDPENWAVAWDELEDDQVVSRVVATQDGIFSFDPTGNIQYSNKWKGVEERQPAWDDIKHLFEEEPEQPTIVSSPTIAQTSNVAKTEKVDESFGAPSEKERQEHGRYSFPEDNETLPKIFESLKNGEEFSVYSAATGYSYYVFRNFGGELEGREPFQSERTFEGIEQLMEAIREWTNPHQDFLGIVDISPRTAIGTKVFASDIIELVPFSRQVPTGYYYTADDAYRPEHEVFVKTGNKNYTYKAAKLKDNRGYLVGYQDPEKMDPDFRRQHPLGYYDFDQKQEWQFYREDPGLPNPIHSSSSPLKASALYPNLFPKKPELDQSK